MRTTVTEFVCYNYWLEVCIAAAHSLKVSVWEQVMKRHLDHTNNLRQGGSFADTGVPFDGQLALRVVATTHQ